MKREDDSEHYIESEEDQGNDGDDVKFDVEYGEKDEDDDDEINLKCGEEDKRWWRRRRWKLGPFFNHGVILSSSKEP